MSKQINDGGAAFPIPNTYHANDQIQYGQDGMTLRDYFAAAALNGFATNSETVTSERELAEWSYSIADEMIKARKGGDQP
jgi:hypothetical protein